MKKYTEPLHKSEIYLDPYNFKNFCNKAPS